MSRHDKVLMGAKVLLDTANLGASRTIIHALKRALQEEIAAHDKTREVGCKAAARAVKLAGNIRGLEAKVRLFEDGDSRAQQWEAIAAEHAANLDKAQDKLGRIGAILEEEDT